MKGVEKIFLNCHSIGKRHRKAEGPVHGPETYKSRHCVASFLWLEEYVQDQARQTLYIKSTK